VVGAAAAAGAVAVGTADASTAARNPGSNGPNSERLVLVKGRIHTMDGSGSVVDSVAIEDGKFVEVGRNVSPRGGRVIDLGGRTVVPGIIDNHNHIVLMGNRPGHHTP
jgi:predicted amidohydrolase YtcJ